MKNNSTKNSIMVGTPMYNGLCLWKKNNGKIFIDPSINLNHVGTYVFEGDLIKYGANIT